MVRTAAAYDEGPISFRYPRGDGVGVDMPERGACWRSARAASSGKAPRWRCCPSARGSQDCLLAAEELGAAGLSTTVADARFAKPLDDGPDPPAGARARGAGHRRGRLGRRLRQPCARISSPANGLLDSGLKVRPLMLPDSFVDHAKPDKMYADAGLDAAGIVHAVFAALGKSDAGGARLSIPRRPRLALAGAAFAIGSHGHFAGKPAPACGSTNCSSAAASSPAARAPATRSARGAVTVDGRPAQKPGQSCRGGCRHRGRRPGAGLCVARSAQADRRPRPFRLRSGGLSMRSTSAPRPAGSRRCCWSAGRRMSWRSMSAMARWTPDCKTDPRVTCRRRAECAQPHDRRP